MLKELKTLAQESAVYGLSTVVGRLLNFFLLPLYTHALVPAEYGAVALVFSYLALLNVVYGWGMDFAFMRHASGEPESPPWKLVFSTAFWSLALSSLVLSCIIHTAANPLARACGLPAGLSDVVRYGAWILALDALALVPFAHLRLSHRAGTYAGIKVANIVMNLALNWVFLVTLDMGVRGVFLASLITSAATLAILAPVILAVLEPSFDAPLWRELLRFALPLLPAGMASMLVQVIDRPILYFLTDEATVGLYQANYRLGIFMMMVVNMFDAAWRPFFLQRARLPGADVVIARVLTYFAAGAGFLFLLVALFVAHVAALPLGEGRTLIHASYWPGLEIVPAVTLGYLFNGIYINLIAGPTLAKRTEMIAAATAAGAAVRVAANFLLVPTFALRGAGWSVPLSYAAMAAAIYGLGRRVHPLPYENRRLLHAALVLAAVWGGAWALGLGTSAERFWPRVALLLAYPVLLAVTGFFNAEERAALAGLLLPRA